MSTEARQQRLQEDLRVLQALRDESTIFDFSAGEGELADQFVLIFKGKGIRRDRNDERGYAEVEEHRCEIRMGYGYPDRAPDLRWITPAFHPNITYSGFISLKDLGLPWDKSIGLDVVCERLWDTARMAHFDLNKASNYNAKNWLETEGVGLELPVDSRPLRDGPAEHINAGSNVVRYQRKGERRLTFPEPEPSTAEEVFFIDDEKAAPIVFETPVRQRGRSSDDDILYIE